MPKTPSEIAKRYTQDADSPEPLLTWFVSRKRASLIGWLVISLYTREKKTPLTVLQAALAEVDFSEAFVSTAAGLKPPYLTLDNQERRFFAYLCSAIRESVPDGSWKGEGREERWVGPDLIALNIEIEELIARLKPLLAQRDALSA